MTRAGARVLFDLSTGRTMEDPEARPVTVQSTIPPISQSVPLTYPATIRVAHHPENACRDVADWQVDVIPFEEYVARSVPAEVPASWPLEALAAQAVAARTYAWYQILQGRPDYDVTDWANFQMMCDDRYPSTDQAAAMTAGQYLSYKGDPQHRPIIAMYSAMNSHPTLDHPTEPYLRAVPDYTGLGEARWGHGYGLSQWGAARRAAQGQTYGQILGHYYTDVHLQNALDPGQPVGALLGIRPGGFLPPGGLRWNVLTPYTEPPAQVQLTSAGGLTRTMELVSTEPLTYTAIITHASGLTETVTLTETVHVTRTVVETGTLDLPTRGVWQRRLSLPTAEPVTATLFLEGTQQDQMTLWLDRTPPAPPTLSGPATSEIHSVTLTFMADPDAQVGLSNGWRWEGEDLLVQPGAGQVISETAASRGAVLVARAGVEQPGVWYGPYATGLPAGATYRAVFRLRSGEHPAARTGDGVLPDQPIARLDVADKGGTVRLGL
ncbi:MAG: SpoIID/LytB domain-containing protein, partial [Caldilineae bacterium]